MRIGVDLGGTKIEFVALSEDGAILSRTRMKTPVGDYGATVDAIRSGVLTLERTLARSGSVGVGIPGSMSPATGLIRNANSTCLNGSPLASDLETALNRPVRLENDANCFVLSEAVDGAGEDHGVVFGVILGTGVGGGIAINGALISGRNAIAGEWGHNPLPWPNDSNRAQGTPCYCGLSNCIETHLSGPALSKAYQAVSGLETSALTVAERAQEGERDANEVLANYEKDLAKSLAHMINILDPDVIVLGGGLSNIRQLYSTVPNLWQEWVFSDTVRTLLRPALHGDSSGVRGAAWLWPE
jgi:fructokinase